MLTEPFLRKASRISAELSEIGYCAVRGAVPAKAVTAIDHNLTPHSAGVPLKSLDPCRGADFDIEDIPCLASTATPVSRSLLP
jgi:hypothetical protein